ncbi:hypothetical protein ACQUY5_23690 [Bacillus cereus]|uniref:hypothetical protein n=1 Tax=Bacillus cereus TaxID=1396 RepID=UPI003D16590E
MLAFGIYLGVGAIVSFFLTRVKARQLSSGVLVLQYFLTVFLWLPMIILGVVVAKKGVKKADKQMGEIDINDLCDTLDGNYYFEKVETEDGETYKQKSETCIVCNHNDPNHLTDQSDYKTYVYDDVEEEKEDEETRTTTIEYKVCSVCMIKGYTGLEYIKEYIERHKPRLSETKEVEIKLD